MKSALHNIVSSFSNYEYDEEKNVITNINGDVTSHFYVSSIVRLTTLLTKLDYTYEVDENGNITPHPPQTTNTFMVQLDSEAKIVDLNHFAYNLTGYTPDEVIGKNWFDIFIPEAIKEEVMQVFQDLFSGSVKHWTYENEITCKNGDKRLLKWSNTIVENINNEPSFINSIGVVVE